jgi:hypothetical protein
VLVAAACLVISLPAFPMAMVEPYGTGRIYPVWRTPEMPKDILSLMNFPGRVYGDYGFFSD